MIEYIEKHRAKLIYFPLFVYWLIMLTATSLPGVDLPKVGVNDKIEHFTAYGILSIFINLAILFQKKYDGIKKYFGLIAIPMIGFYAALDELHQLFIPGRDCDIWDWTADMIGASLGFLLIYIFYKKFINKSY